jgi:tRNA1Val (adenine37-N6)-methyltransferase
VKKRNPFEFKNFTIYQEQVTLPVTTDACLFGAYCNFNNPKRILDLGTGTGLLALMMHQKYPSAQILGIEQHQETAIQAQKNILENNCQSNIQIVQADMFTYQFESTFDAIISNPPFFVNQLESDETERNQARHFQNYNFTDFFNLINSLLDNSGTAWILLPYSALNDIYKYLNHTDLHVHAIIEISPKTDKNAHLIFLQFAKTKPLQIEKKSIFIRNKENKFTLECYKILHPFYKNEALNI